MDIAQLGFQINSRPVASATTELDRMTAAAGRAQTGTERMAAQVMRDTSGIAGGMRSAVGLVGGFVAALASIQTVRALVTMADNWSDLTSRVRVSIGAHGDAAAVMQRLAQVSRQTYSSLQLTAEGFARNATTLNALGVSTERQLDFSQALNNALVISSAKGERAQMVQDSLAKAMAEGSLRGDELNNVLNYGSRVAEVMAAELGVNVTQLRALGAEGKITGDVIFNSLVGNMEALTEQAESMPATVGDAFTLLENSVLAFVGVTDQATQTTSWFAETIITVADAIDILGPQVAQLAQMWATQDAEQGNAADSAQQLAEGMKVVVTGLILAKNAVDVLVSGFQFMVGIAVAAAAEIISSFSRVAELPGIVTKLLSPSTAAQGLGEFAVMLDQSKAAVGRFADEAGRLAGQFAGEWDTNVMDVSNAFEFLEGSATGAEDGMKRSAGEAVKFAAAAEGLSASAKKAADRLRDVAAAQRLQRSADGAGFLNSVRQLAATLNGPLASAMLKYNEQMDEANRLQFEGTITTDQAVEAMALYGEELRRAQEEAASMSEEAQWMQGILDDFNNTGMQGLVREIDRVGEALQKALTPDQKEAMLDYMQRLQGAAADYRQQGLETMVGAAQQVVGSIQSMSKEGSKSYKAMEVASAALNVVMAIGAILNQGKGDPYSAPVRMAAMAAAVAGLVGSIAANFGGSNGFTDTAEERQRSQGTGTVLGDAEAKSESILNASQITADATSELVGINQGMLRALQALQGGLDRAGGMLARGAGRAEFPGVGGSFDFGSAFLGGALSSLPLDPLGILGGSSRVTDQGIALGGGGLDDLNVQAYQEQQYRRWRFGSRRTQEDMSPIGGEFAAQFELIVESISETVRQGAIALGMLPAEVEAALAAFQLEEIRISLKDLSAEEQQAELLAVFSSIFDGIAGSVVPYIEQFQRVGEGLGETLVRVATGVQVTQEAITRLGFSLDATSGEQFAIVSEGLIDMAGGLEEFISGMQSFVENFAPDAHKFTVAQDEINRAFEQAGLVVPATRDGMWELMQSLDATTESGRLQIATLLRLSGTADTYYTMLERREEERLAAFDESAGLEYAEMVGSLNRQLMESQGVSEFRLSLQDIAQEYRTNVGRLNELARAAGLAGAREEDLATALQVSTMQRQRAILALEAEGRALVQSLGLDAMGLLDAEIAALSETEADAARAVQSFGDAITETAQAAWDATQLLLGDLSPLRDREKLALALRGQEAGSVTPEQVLQIGRRLFASGSGDYGALFNQVMQIGDRTNLGGGDVGGGPVDVGTQVSTAMQALLDRRAELEAGQREAERYTQAAELAQIIADSAGATGDSFAEVAARLGLTNLDQLLQPLGLENTEALTSYLTALQADSYGIEDIAATVTAGDQLIVDTLRQIFDMQNLARMLMMDIPELRDRGITDPDGATVLQPGMLVLASEETAERQIDATIENGERFGEGIDRLGEEIVAMRAELSQILADIRGNTGRAAGAGEALAETTAQRVLIGESVSPRGSRFGASVGPL